ncbi:MAG: SoxR reducing system RseC family protein [Gammaproteobacteria bacterium]|nr:SoxR reducing system RseC family protein [Gammaproteobacteria bacterium]
MPSVRGVVRSVSAEGLLEIAPLQSRCDGCNGRCGRLGVTPPEYHLHAESFRYSAGDHVMVHWADGAMFRSVFDVLVLPMVALLAALGLWPYAGAWTVLLVLPVVWRLQGAARSTQRYQIERVDA